MKRTIFILTNNPYVAEKQTGNVPVEYLDTDYVGVLRKARDLIHRGAVLLTHPLYGSVKPGETPYRSVLIREGDGNVDLRSLKLIESALETSLKFKNRTDLFRPEAVKDFQIVDYSLLSGALEAFSER